LPANADDIQGTVRPRLHVIAHPTRLCLGRSWSSRPTHSRSLGSCARRGAVVTSVRGPSPSGRTPCFPYSPDGRRQGTRVAIFVSSHAPRPRMLIFRCHPISPRPSSQAPTSVTGSPCVTQADLCDAALFPVPMRLVSIAHRYLAAELRGSIGARTALCVLTHEPQFDVPGCRSRLRCPR